MIEEIMLNTEEKMEKAIANYNGQLAQIRTGRANPSILDRISIDYYGTYTPINQVASISVPEGRQLLIKPYDKTMIPLIEKAINEANIGLNPQNDGENIRINIPPLTEETRRDLTKDVSKLAEDAKVVVRNIRRDANDNIKKDKDLTEDDSKGYQEDVQTLTDKTIKLIESIAKEKEVEIMTV